MGIIGHRSLLLEVGDLNIAVVLLALSHFKDREVNLLTAAVLLLHSPVDESLLKVLSMILIVIQEGDKMGGLNEPLHKLEVVLRMRQDELLHIVIFLQIEGFVLDVVLNFQRTA